MLLSSLLVLKIETDHEMAYSYATRLDVAREGGKVAVWRYNSTSFPYQLMRLNWFTSC
jgi:hypothetical protein